MHITIHPLQLVSRIVAVCLVALPLAFVLSAVEDFEQEAIRKMSHQELLAYVREGHSSSFSAGYFQVAITTLIFLLVVEALAFGFRLLIGLLTAKKPARVREEELVSAGADF